MGWWRHVNDTYNTIKVINKVIVDFILVIDRKQKGNIQWWLQFWHALCFYRQFLEAVLTKTQTGSGEKQAASPAELCFLEWVCIISELTNFPWQSNPSSTSKKGNNSFFTRLLQCSEMYTRLVSFQTAVMLFCTRCDEIKRAFSLTWAHKIQALSPIRGITHYQMTSPFSFFFFCFFFSPHLVSSSA